MKKVMLPILALLIGFMVFYPGNAWSYGDRAGDLVIELASGSGWQMVSVDQERLRQVGSLCIQDTPNKILCRNQARGGSLRGHVEFTKSTGSPPQKITAVYNITHHGCRRRAIKLPSGIVLFSSDCKCMPPAIQHTSGNGSLGYSVETCLRDTNGNEKPLRVMFR